MILLDAPAYPPGEPETWEAAGYHGLAVAGRLVAVVRIAARSRVALLARWYQRAVTEHAAEVQRLTEADGEDAEVLAAWRRLLGAHGHVLASLWYPALATLDGLPSVDDLRAEHGLWAEVERGALLAEWLVETYGLTEDAVGALARRALEASAVYADSAEVASLAAHFRAA